MNPIRFATWAAVSTDAQAAEDKFSLETQVEVSRQAAKGKGWVETSTYIVPGESRTKWVNLSDAEQAIPQLHQLLDDAQAGKFDVLVCAEYDRFRELLDPVARTLSHYGVQIYSVSQPIEPQNPAIFNPYSSDSEPILRSMSQIISRAAISNLRRKYYSEMPKRVTERGLPAATMPWGYRKPSGRERDSSAIPEQDPAQVAMLIMMKDMLLAGRSTYQIVAELDRMLVPPPKPHLRNNNRLGWDATTVMRLLVNPFYAGYVRWGVSKSKRDLRIGKTVRTMQPENQIITSRGAHLPIWDDSTLAAIKAELKRRNRGHRGNVTHQLTSLLACSVCGAMLWRGTRGSHTDKAKQYMTWRCRYQWAGHVTQSNELMISRVAEKLEEYLVKQQVVSPEKSVDNELSDLRKRRERVEEAYEVGAFDLVKFIERTTDLDKRIKELEASKRESEQTYTGAIMRNQAVEKLREMLKDVSMVEFLHGPDPQEVNMLLRTIIEKIVVDTQGNILEVVPK